MKDLLRRASVVWATVLGAMIASGCLQSSVVACGDGLFCAEGRACDVVHGLCVLPEQLETCVGAPDGTACEIRVPGDGRCLDQVCLGAVCGDGIVSGSEQCDGDELGGATCESLGAHQPGTLRCTPSCTFDLSECGPRCGDGTVDGPEECDGVSLREEADDCTELDFYDPGPLSCNAQCALVDNACTGFCGDGIVNGGEVCDDSVPLGNTCVSFGYDAGRLRCNSFCAPAFGECSTLGWRQSNIGSGADVNGVWAVSANDVWAVGDGGVVSHWNGSQWQVEATGTTQFLVDVWANETDVFIAGNVLLHRIGGTWTVTPAPANTFYFGVWGFSSTDVYAVAERTTDEAGVVTHFDGTSWSEVAILPHAARVIWGAAPDDVWIGTKDGNVYRGANGTWDELPMPRTTEVRAIWGFGPDDVWISLAPVEQGEEPILRWDGAAWNPVPTIAGHKTPTALWGVSANNVFGAQPSYLHRYDGTRWLEHIVPNGMQDITGADGIVFAVGQAGRVWRYEGAAELAEHRNLPADLLGCVAFSPGSALAVAGADLWESGSTAREDWDDVVLPGGGVVRALWSEGPEHVLVGVNASGSALVERGPGGMWTPISIPDDVKLTGVTAVWSTDGELFVVGQDAVTNTDGILHRDGAGMWQRELTVTANTLNAIRGRSANDVYAVGREGRIFHREGTAWTEMASPTTSRIVAIERVGDDMIAATQGGQILRLAGSTWTVEATPPSARLTSIWAAAPDDVFVGGVDGFLHYDGEHWSPIRLEHDVAHVCGVGSSILMLGQFDNPISATRAVWLDRTTRWHCRASETSCDDGIDDDCDQLIDGADSECP